MDSIDHWKTLEREDLQKNYSPSRWCIGKTPEEAYVEYYSLRKEATARYRVDGGGEWAVPYGPKPTQTVDFYRREGMPKDSPMMVYFRGGYWKLGNMLECGFLAGPLNDAGISLAVVDFTMVPAVSVDGVVEDATLALAMVLARAETDGCGTVVIGGHCSGGHLALMGAMRNCANPILKGCVPLSGVYDVRPLVLYNDNSYFKLTDESAWELSPIREELLQRLKERCSHVLFLIMCVDNDPPEYLRQSRLYNQKLEENQLETSLLIAEKSDHLSILTDACTSPSAILIQTLVEFVKKCALR